MKKGFSKTHIYWWNNIKLETSSITDSKAPRVLTTDRPPDQLTDWLTDWLTDSLTDWFTDWLRLADWLADWLTDSLGLKKTPEIPITLSTLNYPATLFYILIFTQFFLKYANLGKFLCKFFDKAKKTYRISEWTASSKC